MSLDLLIRTFDRGLRTLYAKPTHARQNPSEKIAEADLTPQEKQQVAALMRVNHVGEVCAQALYAGQALVSKNPQTVQALQHAANEEIEHLAWCEQRIAELGGRKSILNPVWYAGSFAIGAGAGLLGERWNLGFLAETEQQVAQHLQSHLERLPETDAKTRAIVAQMEIDEAEHAREAIALGGSELPKPVKKIMQIASTCMTKTAYHV